MKPSPKRILHFLLVLFAFAYSGCSQQGKIDSSLAKANEYFANGDYSSAEIEYKNVLQLDSGIPDAIGNLGLIYQSQGRLRQAYPFLNQMRVISPEDIKYRAKLAALLLDANDADAAWSEATFVLEQDPLNPIAPLVLQGAAPRLKRIAEARELLKSLREENETAALLVALGMLDANEGDLGSAEATFKEAIALSPDFSDAHIAVANILWAKKDSTAANLAFQKACDTSDNEPNKLVRYARFKLGTGEKERAIELIDQALEKELKFVPALQAKANLYLTDKKLDEATELSNRLLSLTPYNLEALELDAKLRLGKGETDDAIKVLERALEIYPELPRLNYQLALAHLAKNQQVEAAANLTKVLSANPKHSQASLLLAAIDARQGATDNAIVSISRLLESDPNNIQAKSMLAQLHTEKENFEQALAIYRELSELLPSNPQNPQLAADTLLRLGRKDEAYKFLETSLERNGDYLVAFERITDLNIADKKFDEAIARIDAKLIEFPESPIPLFLKAKVFISSERGDEAETLLKKSIELQSELRPARLLLAKFYQSQGRQDEAFEQYEFMVGINPKDSASWLELGAIHERKSDFDAAIEAYEKAKEQSPENGVLLNNLAYLYSEHKREHDKSYELALKARDLLPSDPAVADTLGWIAYRKGEYDFALGLIEESARKIGKHPEIQYHLAKIHQALGNTADTQTAAQEALHLGLSGEKAKEMKTLLP